MLAPGARYVRGEGTLSVGAFPSAILARGDGTDVGGACLLPTFSSVSRSDPFGKGADGWTSPSFPFDAVASGLDGASAAFAALRIAASPADVAAAGCVKTGASPLAAESPRKGLASTLAACTIPALTLRSNA